MIIGDYNILKVIRESDIAYILSDGETEVFLHKKEALEDYQPDQKIRVFLYVDNQGRITASTRQAYLALDEGGFLEVVGVNYELGVFLNNNLVKDLLLSKDDLPFNLDIWPQVKDKLFVTLRLKKNTLFAKFVGRKQIAGYFPLTPDLELDNTYQANVQYILPEGIVAFTEQGKEIFVHINNTRKTYRLGESIMPKLLKLNDSGEYVGTLIEAKENMISLDAKKIFKFLEERGGTMRFTDKSSPEEVQAAFKMSKSAFKRALGSLYKQGYVELFPDVTKIKIK
ncbi:MAG: hypothetical protein JXB20_00360 [Bacilli bacterium]|nr:hypothetical protein [Bacilli bacterium]MBN2697148.1 hypothetical protein [Bacilli bacterium]